MHESLKGGAPHLFLAAMILVVTTSLAWKYDICVCVSNALIHYFYHDILVEHDE